MKKKTKGFTLIELTISLFVIALGLLGMLMANSTIQRMSESAHEEMLAVQDAERLVELMRNASAAGNFPTNVTAVYPNGYSAPVFSAGLVNGTLAVSYVNPSADPLDVTVTTSWRKLGVRNTSLQLRTLMTQRRTS